MSNILILSRQMETMSNPATRGERLQIMVSAQELIALDDFRFRHRLPSRSATVRELLKRGLNAEGFEAADFGTKSEQYGVIGKTPKGRQTGKAVGKADNVRTMEQSKVA